MFPGTGPAVPAAGPAPAGKASWGAVPTWGSGGKGIELVSEALRLADILAALSITTDLVMGHEPEKAVRSTVLATEMARHLDLPDTEVADVFYTTLLKHLGCTATTHEEVLLFGPDDLGARPVAERTDERNVREALRLLATTGKETGIRRPAFLARAVTAGKETQRIFLAICEVGTRMAARLGLGEEVERAL